MKILASNLNLTIFALNFVLLVGCKNSIDVEKKSGTLTASDLCTGKSIFGSAGTAVCNSVFSDLMASSMYRNVVTTQMTLATETSTLSYASGYRDVPDVTKDDDGFDASSPIVKALRPATTCGTTQAAIAARIAHCLAQNPTTATWNGATKGISGQGTWKLVTRTAGVKEVWKDERTGLLWGDHAGTSNWCRASGNAQTAAQDVTEICDPANPLGYQDATPTSICSESGSLEPTLAGENWTTGVYDASKGGMGAVATGSSPSVRWRLPTMDDWQMANVNGIRFVLPNMVSSFWSATVFSPYRRNAWNFDGSFGYTFNTGRTVSLAVRCLGR